MFSRKMIGDPSLEIWKLQSPPLSLSAAAGGSRKLLRPRATERRPVAAGTQPRGVELLILITRAD